MRHKSWTPPTLGLHGYTPENQRVVVRKRANVFVALFNFAALVSMPVWGGLLVFSVFACGFFRRDPEWRDYLTGRLNLLQGVSDLYTP